MDRDPLDAWLAHAIRLMSEDPARFAEMMAEVSELLGDEFAAGLAERLAAVRS